MLVLGRSHAITRHVWRSFSKSSRLHEAKPTAALPHAAQNIKASSELLPGAVKDIIIYKYESPRFYRNLNFFAIAQYTFWLVISYCGLQMIDIPVDEHGVVVLKTEDSTSSNDKNENISAKGGISDNSFINESKANNVKSKIEGKREGEEELPFWRTINLGSDVYKYGLSVGSAFMGFAILFVSWTYILRSVRYLVLRKDGKTVSFVTYTPFGQNRIMDVPIRNISAGGSRNSGTSQMPVKVKGMRLFYLIDLKDGSFPQPQLFDRTVGTKRKF